MDVSQDIGNRRGDMRGTLRGQLPFFFKNIAQRFPGELFGHHVKPGPVRVRNYFDDAWVVQPCSDFQFTPEAIGECRVARHVGVRNFDCYFPAIAQVCSLKDRGFIALGQPPQKSVLEVDHCRQGRQCFYNYRCNILDPLQWRVFFIQVPPDKCECHHRLSAPYVRPTPAKRIPDNLGHGE